MKTLTHKYVAVIAFATLLLAAIAPRVADACGYYSDEQAVSHMARWMFWTGPKTDMNDLAKSYPKIPESQLSMILDEGGKQARAVGVEVVKKTAAVFVEVDGDAIFEVSFQLEEGFQNWRPVAIRRATANEAMTLKALDKIGRVSRQLAWSASAKLAKR